MKKFNVSMVALTIGFAFNTAAIAEPISKQEYQSIEKSIDAAYDASKKGCDSLAGNANDICIADAKGRKSVSKAELEYKYKPAVKTLYEARVARADADYSVAIERCDEKAGNAKDVCVKEAKAAKTHALTDAEAQMKAQKADAVAVGKSIDANTKAVEKATDAKIEATEKSLDADYAVAKEKCDILAGDAKKICLSDAKTRFGKN